MNINGIGVESLGGPLELYNTLIADSTSAAVRLAGVDSTLVLFFSTIADCGQSVDNDTGVPANVTILQSILSASGFASGIGCAQLDFSVLDTLFTTCCLSNPNNVCTDPLFADPVNDDYRLTFGSPVIDTGFDPSFYTGIPCYDLDLGLRIRDGDGDGLARPDPGAYEFVYPMGLEPGAVSGLLFDAPLSLNWDPVPAASSYGIYRADLSGLGYGTVFPAVDSSNNSSATLPVDDPLPGEAYVYLVTALNNASLEGTLGFATCAERSNPTPLSPSEESPQ